MTVSHVFILIYVLLIALFSVWAWKLWHGQWLSSIAGNTFATKEELDLPYQKRMAKEVAALLVICDLLFAALIARELASASEHTFLLVALSFVVTLIAGCAAVVVRANKAAKREQVEAGLRKQGFPTKETDPEFGGGEEAGRGSVDLRRNRGVAFRSMRLHGLLPRMDRLTGSSVRSRVEITKYQLDETHSRYLRERNVLVDGFYGDHSDRPPTLDCREPRERLTAMASFSS